MTANLRTSRRVAALAFLALLMLEGPAGAQPVQIYPSPGTTRGPIVIAVLADHYQGSASDIAKFNQAAYNLFNIGLATDAYYQGQASKFTITTLFQAWTPSAATPESNYFFTTAGTGICRIHYDTVKTPAAIEQAVRGPINPTRTVVIGNYDYTFGCRDGDWLYVSAGAVGSGVLEHEFGHLLGDLFDEFALTHNAGTNYPTYLNRANCSTEAVATKRVWANLGLVGVANELACDLYGLQIWHPFHDCRMRIYTVGFCPVCKLEMDTELSELSAPASPMVIPSAPTNLRIVGASLFGQPAPAVPLKPEDRSVHVLVSLDRVSLTATIVSATDVPARVATRHRRTGDYVYEITDHGKTFATGVIGGDPFQVRSYGGGSAPHQAAEKTVADIVVPIPGVTRGTLQTPAREVEILFYKLDPTVNNDPITPARLAVLKTTNVARLLTRVTQQALKAAVR